jgi:hypothetical protein
LIIIYFVIIIYLIIFFVIIIFLFVFFVIIIFMIRILRLLHNHVTLDRLHNFIGVNNSGVVEICHPIERKHVQEDLFLFFH